MNYKRLVILIFGVIAIRIYSLPLIQMNHNNSTSIMQVDRYSMNSNEPYFKCNGYLIDSKMLIREIQMGFSDYMRYKKLSNNDKNEIANYVAELIELIKKGQCYFELNNMMFVNNDYAVQKRTDNSFSNLQDACYYISQIAIKMVKRGDYVGTY